MSNRTFQRMAGLASAVTLAAGLGVAVPAAAQAAPRPATAPSGWYILYLNSNYTAIDSEGNGTGSDNPVGTWIKSVSNNTGWTLKLYPGNGTATTIIPPHTNENDADIYVSYYSVG